jgi:hypothetical protein
MISSCLFLNQNRKLTTTNDKTVGLRISPITSILSISDDDFRFLGLFIYHQCMVGLACTPDWCNSDLFLSSGKRAFSCSGISSKGWIRLSSHIVRTRIELMVYGSECKWQLVQR